jgi:hypothetical protein
VILTDLHVFIPLPPQIRKKKCFFSNAVCTSVCSYASTVYVYVSMYVWMDELKDVHLIRASTDQFYSYLLFQISSVMGQFPVNMF